MSDDDDDDDDSNYIVTVVVIMFTWVIMLACINSPKFEPGK